VLGLNNFGMQFDIITIFSEVFDTYFNTSILKRAQRKKLIKIKIHNLRRWACDKHKTVDDTPYGGGPGMILKVEPLWRAISTLSKTKNKKSKIKNPNEKTKKQKIILLTPKGKQFDQKMAQRFSKLDRIILICGRYEGVDARVEKFVDEEISVGPYVLTGGELPAMLIVDAVTRLVPGVIKPESLEEETFVSRIDTNLTTNSTNIRKISGQISANSRVIEYPQYTRPEVFTYKDKSGKIRKLKVPKILLSGNHKKITEWRQRHCNL